MSSGRAVSLAPLFVAGALGLGSCRSVAGQGHVAGTRIASSGDHQKSPPLGTAADDGDASCDIDTQVVAIAASANGSSTCALRSTGTVCCWEPCVAETRDHSLATPVRVGPPASRAAHIAIGAQMGCAVTDAATAFCWENEDVANKNAVPWHEVDLPEPAVSLRLVPELGQADETRAYARLADGRIVKWRPGPSAAAGASAVVPLHDLPGVVGDEQGACERNATGHVRCHGTDEQLPMRAGSGHPPLWLSDGAWRSVPRLFGARQLGVDAFCAWGIVAGDRVRAECVYAEVDWSSVCSAPTGHARAGCESWTRRSYLSDGIRFHKDSLEYRAPHVERLVSFDVGLDDGGQMFVFDGHKAVPVGQSTYRDIAGGADHITALTRDGTVMQFCGGDRPGDEGGDDLAPSDVERNGPGAVTSCDAAEGNALGNFAPSIDEVVAAVRVMPEFCVSSKDRESAVRACAAKIGTTKIRLGVTMKGEEHYCWESILPASWGERRFIRIRATSQSGGSFTDGPAASAEIKPAGTTLEVDNRQGLGCATDAQTPPGALASLHALPTELKRWLCGAR